MSGPGQINELVGAKGAALRSTNSRLLFQEEEERGFTYEQLHVEKSTNPSFHGKYEKVSNGRSINKKYATERRAK